jgi:hypothetical protein
MVIVERIEDLATILAAADQPQLTESAQLVRHSGFGHFELSGKFSDIPLAIEQERDDAQTRRVTEGAEKVSQVSGSVFL